MHIFADGILHDKVVLVTGGGTGIGRGIALGMAGYGAHLVLASRHVDHLRAVAHEAQAQGVQAFPVRTDVRDPAQVQALIQVALDTFGRIDVLVNNAAGSFLSAARKLTHKGWHSVVDTTLNGTFYCSQAVGRADDRTRRWEDHQHHSHAAFQRFPWPRCSHCSEGWRGGPHQNSGPGMG